MERSRLTQTGAPFFREAWALYEEAFPPEERRTRTKQAELMGKPEYHFEVASEKGTFIGFLLWWEFEGLRYLEHLATVPILRGRGKGKLLLEEFMHRDTRPVLLDVEPPEDEIRQRRIRFYERNGFRCNPRNYFQPPMQEGYGPVKLMLMSFPAPLSSEAIAYFIADCHPAIYG